MKGISIIRDDGARGTVVGEETAGGLVIEFNDGSRMVVSRSVLVPQQDGTYRLWLGTGSSANISTGVTVPTGVSAESEEMVIPVIAEEATVEKHLVERAKVLVHKRIETREEVFNTPVFHEEVVVERIPVNRLVEESVAEVREEDGVLIIPLIEEVIVVEKRLLVREEIHVSRRRTTETDSQTVTLRREVVEVERIELNPAERLEA